MLAADNAPAVNEAKVSAVPTVWVFPTAKISKHPLVRGQSLAAAKDQSQCSIVSIRF
jgi:hypothetical protein